MATWTVGMLYPIDGAYPNPIQPGGPGNPVTMPLQQSGEKTGRFFFGCGHSIMSMHVVEVFDPPSGKQAALLCCPLCGWIQRKLVPYSLIHDNAQNPILLA